MKELFFIRHGEQCDSGKFNSLSSLTDFGISQAKRTGNELNKIGCTIIYSSPLPRALETSQIISNYVNGCVLVREELREINYGLLEGFNISDLDDENMRTLRTITSGKEDIPYPYGECGEDVFSRLSRFIRNDISGDSNSKIAIVTHGEVILSLLCSIQKKEFYKRFSIAWLDHCGISKILLINETMRIRYINNVSHLHKIKATDFSNKQGI